MSYTPEDQLFDDKIQKTMSCIDDVRAVIKARRLNTTGDAWKKTHIFEIVEIDAMLDHLYWRLKDLDDDINR